MNAKSFSDAMSELDNKYIDEALNYKKKAKKPIWVKRGTMAACLCLVVVAAFVLTRTTSNEFSVEKFDQSQTYPEAPVSLVKIYTSLTEIADDAEVIVRVSVSGSKEVYLDGHPQIHTSVKVLEALKGDISTNDVLTIVEEGSGETVVSGIPLLDPSNEYVLFLTQYEGKYYICGAFQGRFMIEQDYVFQQATEDAKLRNYQPLKYADFVHALDH